MIPISRRRAAAFLAAGLVVLATGLAACAKKITSLDPDFSPEGQKTPGAQMVVWREGATSVTVYEDNLPLGADIDNCNQQQPGLGDPAVETFEYRRGPNTTVRGLILDNTQAREFQLMRREEGGVYRPFQDFTLKPQRRWLAQQWESYSFLDSLPSSFSPPTYLGRGVVSGAITPNAPLTNPGAAHLDAVADIVYTGLCRPTDSLFTLQWNAVPGAARYWLHVYRFAQTPSPAGLLASSVPAPINEIQPTDFLVGYIDTLHDAGGGTLPPATSYRLGDVSRRDVTILVQRPPGFLEYFVRIAAVDTLGQLIAVSRGDYGLISGIGAYGMFRLRSDIVSPRRSSNPVPTEGTADRERRFVRVEDREGRFVRRR